ncbi:NAD(P)H-hydrate dehydratase [Sphingomonas sediminicola]|uniref:Bifunctional NAD(P)H-hydrate repair enzyme n=2 Tax=Sphingomonas sediminicola TaxID=386874 RepID=A0ABX6TD62_9SPHN|nr:NAD(P)H-hydrate dehydratase [Sphingomonas sediminicola]
MRAAEQRAIAAGTSVEALMERAGAALAEAAYCHAGKMPALILCGPGNNGGDGYVAARHLADRGVEVRIAAISEPKSEAAKWARGQWRGEVEALNSSTGPSLLLIDALFGTGLREGLEDALQKQFYRLAADSQMRIACDVPSGVDSDSGVELSSVPGFEMTVTFGALKPAHRLMPSMGKCGRVVLADIGIEASPEWHELGQPVLPALDPGGHKYSRGLVHALAGKMPGAIALSAKAAAYSGAGYVRVSTSRSIDGLPSAIVQTDTAEINDGRIGCLIVGPGMGDIPRVLTLALTSHAPKVIDADAITHLGEPERLRGQDAIITPHQGEFERLFGKLEGSKADRALEAAKRSGAVIVYKGPDTLVASPDGRLGFAPPAPAWLASAGTGDVLAGMIAAMRGRGLEAFEAASAAVWLHGRAAEIAGAQMIADDLAAAIPQALALLND